VFVGENTSHKTHDANANHDELHLLRVTKRIRKLVTLTSLKRHTSSQECVNTYIRAYKISFEKHAPYSCGLFCKIPRYFCGVHLYTHRRALSLSFTHTHIHAHTYTYTHIHIHTCFLSLSLPPSLLQCCVVVDLMPKNVILHILFFSLPPFHYSVVLWWV